MEILTVQLPIFSAAQSVIHLAAEPLSQVQQGVHRCLDQLTGVDWVGVVTFSSTVQLIDSDQKKDLDLSKFQRSPSSHLPLAARLS